MIKLDDYKGRLMWHLFTLHNRADYAMILEYVEQEHGGHYDGQGNLIFDTPEQETWFVVRWS